MAFARNAEVEGDLFGPVPSLPAVAVPQDDWPSDYEEQFWREYPLRVSKKKAMEKLAVVRAAGVSFAKVMAKVLRYKIYLAEASPTVWRPAPKHPTTWLNQGCWDDELETGNGTSANDRSMDNGRSGQRHDAVVTGVGRAFARRFARGAAGYDANGVSGNGDTATRIDPDSSGAADDRQPQGSVRAITYRDPASR